MATIRVTREDFLNDAQGKTFADVVNDSEQPFDELLRFFNEAERQVRMEEAEVHHDRAPLAGVVRELEALAAIDQFLTGTQVPRNRRFRQAVGVVVRMIMERRGWRTTGTKGSLGVRAVRSETLPPHNVGGLSFWFVRAERYERRVGVVYPSVRERCQKLERTPSPARSKAPAKSPPRV